jgi:hypothetical protein
VFLFHYSCTGSSYTHCHSLTFCYFFGCVLIDSREFLSRGKVSEAERAAGGMLQPGLGKKSYLLDNEENTICNKISMLLDMYI